MYGKIFGIYQVCDPWVYVADPEIIKQICIKVRLTFQRSFFSQNIEVSNLNTLTFLCFISKASL